MSSTFCVIFHEDLNNHVKPEGARFFYKKKSLSLSLMLDAQAHLDLDLPQVVFFERNRATRDNDRGTSREDVPSNEETKTNEREK